ncbi:MAG: glutathionylspermidine synthase family protein [Gemmataceae bacterium]
MHRVASPPRPDWQSKCETVGFPHHTTEAGPYWDESACYEFRTDEVDTLETATHALQEMCLEAVQHVIDEKRYGLFRIAEQFEELIERSWNDDERTVYGRFDLAYDGRNPPKLLEYNADTPTALVEASVVQWHWLQDLHPEGDQFNSIHERLIEAWQMVHEQSALPVHFASMRDSLEDAATADYLMDTAVQAGLKTAMLDIQQVGWDDGFRTFVDDRGRPIEQLFKLYPWEWLFSEQFAGHIPNARTRWIEPPWKAILSCKAILPLLWELNPNSPYLLPASFTPLEGDYVQKPIHSREGANVRLFRQGHEQSHTEGPYDETFSIYQQLANIPNFNGNYPILGSWVVNGWSCGIGVREDTSLITGNLSRFVPHRMV